MVAWPASCNLKRERSVVRIVHYALVIAATLLAAPVYAQGKPAAGKPADNMQILRK